MQVSFFDSITEVVGLTPIVSIYDPIIIPASKQLYLKLEYFNPNFSIKDRTAMGLVKDAIAKGALKPGGILIESTSGNLGKALAMFGAVYRFNVIIVVDPKVNRSVLNWVKAYGAQVELVTEPDEFGGFQQTRLQRVRELLDANPGAFWPNQYDNPSNPLYHEVITSEEIRCLAVDCVAGSVSTGGHLTGIGRRLKRENSNTRVLAVDVDGSVALGGSFHPYKLNGVGLAWRAANTDLTAYDFGCTVTDQEAISTCRLMAAQHGVLVGGSGGLVIAAAIAYLRTADARSCLAIVPDSGINYLDQIYDDDWIQRHGISLMTREALVHSLAAGRIRNFSTQAN